MSDVKQDEGAPATAAVVAETIASAPDATSEAAPKTEAADDKMDGGADAKAEAGGETKDAPKNQDTQPSTDGAENPTAPLPMLKTTGRIDHDDRKKNNKFDPSTMEVTSDPEQICRQVNFYFGDSNMPNDKFMMEITGGIENRAVPLKKICSFKRMQRFQPYSAVVAALKENNFLVVEGAEGEETIRRKRAYKPMDDAGRVALARSVYVKGFGDEQPSTQFKIEAWFQKFGPTNRIKLRRTPQDFFKGSVFTEFQTEELAKAFLALDPKPTWHGHELLIMSKKDYLEMKNEGIRNGTIEPHKGSNFRGGYKGKNPKHSGDNTQKNGQRPRHNQGGRGGQGRGGGRRDNQRNHHNRKRDNNGNRGDRPKRDDRDAAMPTIQATNDKGEAIKQTTDAGADANANTNGKRPREEDSAAASGEPAAKKADNKAETAKTETAKTETATES